MLYTALVLLLTILTVGGTYSFFTATANSNSNEINFNATKFEVLYTGGTAIEGSLIPAKNKEEGFNTTVNIKISESSVQGTANLYINIEQITASIASEALKWEVYKTVDGTNSLVKTGSFVDCETSGTKKQCAAGDKLYIVKDYPLSTTNTAFTVYIWLDGYKSGNEVIGAQLKAYIGAESGNITGNLG